MTLTNQLEATKIYSCPVLFFEQERIRKKIRYELLDLPTRWIMCIDTDLLDYCISWISRDSNTHRGQRIAKAIYALELKELYHPLLEEITRL